MYSYYQQDSYWGEGDHQRHNGMVEQGYNTYNERYQPASGGNPYSIQYDSAFSDLANKVDYLIAKLDAFNPNNSSPFAANSTIYCQFCGSSSHFAETCSYLQLENDSQQEDVNFVGGNQSSNFASGKSTNPYYHQNPEPFSNQVAPAPNLSRVEEMLALILQSQERMMNEFDQGAQQPNQSWDNECEDGVNGTCDDELLEYTFGQPGQAEKELCKDNASLSEECIPETPEYPPTVDEFETSVDPEIKLEFFTLVDDPKCEEYVDPFLQPTEENSRLNLVELVKKEQEEWAPLNIIEDFKKVSILLDVNVEDPFLVMPPLNKFECFQPFMVKLDSESTHYPLIIQQAIIHLERMGTHLKVHCRLDGRRFKWDLKVD